MDTLYIYLCKKADCQKWHGKNRVCRYTAVSRKVVLSPGQTDLQVVASSRKLNSRRDLRWVAKRWKTCVDLRANLISTKVSASQPKCTQAPAKRSRKLTQVFNLRRQLASPFGQGLRSTQHVPHQTYAGKRTSPTITGNTSVYIQAACRQDLWIRGTCQLLTVV